MWFHPDLLTHEIKPSITKYFFATNNHQIYFDVNTQKLMFKAYNDIKDYTFNLNQKISYYGWNHLIFHSYEDKIQEKIFLYFQ